MKTITNDWQTHFIQTGEDSNQPFEDTSLQTIKNLNQLFSDCKQPYSGLVPIELEKAVYATDLTKTLPMNQVIDQVNELIAKNSIIVQHPHCIAHLHTPPLLASVIAEFYIAALNQSMDSWDQASAATYVEQFIIDWLVSSFKLTNKSDGVFTSGGTQSNFMGLLLARDWFVKQHSDHNVQKDGLPDYASKLRFICSDKSHFSVQKSAALMGLGERSVITVPTNIQGQLDCDALDTCLNDLKAQGLLPVAIVATAGTTDHGAIDELDTIINISHQHACWCHIDSAYGGALMLSDTHQSKLNGIENADSISVDFHKLFYQTISCGALLVKDKNNFNTFCHHADYLSREGDELPNLVDKSIATTKRFDALKMFMTLKSVGEKTLGEMVDQLMILTPQVAELVKENDNFELCCDPLLSTVLFRLSARYQHDLTDQQFNELHQTLRLTLLTSGDAVIAETKVDGQVYLKFTLLNPCLTLDDFDSLFKKIESSAHQLIKN